jgi:hypothetical protein
MARQRKVSTSRVIAADRQAIFEVIADPSLHPVIDGSGTVGGAQAGGPERLALGARFGMDMKMRASYKILNEVVEFEEGRVIAWRHFNGHRWRYAFGDVPGGTEVTETFDWSIAKAKLPLELAGFPKRNLAAMRATLERLDRYVITGSAEGVDAA